MAELTTDALRVALAGEFRTAIEGVLGNVLTTTDGTAAGGSGWGTPITVSGATTGQLTAWVDDAGILALARAMTGLDAPPEPGAASDMLRELWAHAAAGLSAKSSYAGLTLDVGPATPGTLPSSGHSLLMREGAAVLATLVVTGSVGRGVAAASPAAAAERPEYPGNLAALLDIDLPLVVRFARTEMPLRALAQLAPGSMVDMGRSPDAPVQLLIGSQVIAEGEVVVVSGNYGVRITSLVSPADRLRAMEL